MQINQLQLQRAKEISDLYKNRKEDGVVVFVRFYRHYSSPKDLFVETLIEGWDGEKFYHTTEYNCIDPNGESKDCRNSFDDNRERSTFYSEMSELKLEGITYNK